MIYETFAKDFKKDSILVLEVYGYGQISVDFMVEGGSFLSDTHLISN